jgi:predicted nucleotidyltransferase
MAPSDLFADIKSVTIPSALLGDIKSVTIPSDLLADIKSVTIPSDLLAEIKSVMAPSDLFADIKSVMAPSDLFADIKSVTIPSALLGDIKSVMAPDIATIDMFADPEIRSIIQRLGRTELRTDRGREHQKATISILIGTLAVALTVHLSAVALLAYRNDAFARSVQTVATELAVLVAIGSLIYHRQ